MNKLKISKQITLMLVLGLLSGTILNPEPVNGSNNYAAITNTQTLDVNYTIFQAQPMVRITQVRAGNDVTNGTSGWSAWTDITDASGSAIPGGLLVGTATLKNWTLPLANENKQTRVCVQLKDTNGNVTPWDSNCNLVYWDTLAPTQTSFTFNNNNGWDNDGLLPINLSLVDPVGISEYVGISISDNGGPDFYLSGISCTYNATWKAYDCLFNSIYTAIPQSGSSTFVITYRDNLDNIGQTVPVNIRFDEEKPVGTVSITQDASASNLVNITYSATDMPGTGGLSGIQRITIENVTTNQNNINREVIYTAPGVTQETVSGTKNLYEITERFGTIKMTIQDLAGNITEIYSNTVTANRVGLESTSINKVVNPSKYPISNAYAPISITGKEPLEELPEAVAGGNLEVTQNFYWDADVTEVSGFYQYVISSGNGYLKHETVQFDLSDILVNGTSASLVMKTMIDELAPVSTESNDTYVLLQMEMHVTLNGLSAPVPLYFPSKGELYKVATVSGSIDDSINFESK